MVCTKVKQEVLGLFKSRVRDGLLKHAPFHCFFRPFKLLKYLGTNQILMTTYNVSIRSAKTGEIRRIRGCNRYLCALTTMLRLNTFLLSIFYTAYFFTIIDKT